MNPADQCNSCRHIGKGWGHEHCKLFALAPSKPCVHNTFQPAAMKASRMQRAERIAQRANDTTGSSTP